MANSTAELRSLLTDWLVHDSRPVLIARSNSGLRDGNRQGARQPLTIEDVVKGLLGDPTPMPSEAVKALALPAGTRASAVARLLVWAAEEPAGPRCRSYRAASYFLADLDAGELEELLPARPDLG